MSEHDAAYLRMIFYQASEAQDIWRKNPMIIWQHLYEAIRDSEGGLYVLKKMQEQEAEISRLLVEIDRLNTEIVKQRPKQLEIKP